MIPAEIGPFLKRVAVTDPRILPSDEDEAFAATALWAVALADVDFAFALNAVATHYSRSPFLVKPSDIADQWRAHVKNSVSHYIDPAPDTDDPHEYIQQLAAGRHAARHGHILTGRQAIGPGQYETAVNAAAAHYSEDDIKAIRAEGDFKRMWIDSQRAAQDAAEARKRLVLQHEDLAEALRIAHGLTAADRWNGRIPPEFTPSGSRNPSPIRAALVAIVAEAQARQDGHQTAA